ncbi:MAG: 4'-phosphopantetheinyl transferase superfamily protein [Bacteroidota bacterium]
MIGVDIIDLREVYWKSSTHLDRYAQKAFSLVEQECLNQHTSDKGLAIWTGWAIKESVYKLAFRSKPERYFKPKRLQLLSIDDADHFAVLDQSDQKVYKGKVIQTADYILAIATTSTDAVENRAFAISKLNQSEATRAYTEQALIRWLGIDRIRIDWRPYPIAFLGDKEIAHLSISHHGQWATYAFYPVRIKQSLP